MRCGRGTSRALVAALVATFAVGLPVAAASSTDRALRDVVGPVEAVREAAGVDGAPWLEITLRTQRGETVVARVAPLEILQANDFRIAVGDTARVRVFSDERPVGVSRIRNLSTGETLRLRCLSGEPIWSLREPRAAGAGPGGQHARPDPGRGRPVR